MSENILTLTDHAFQSDVIQSNQLTLVDFWAEWCGPCRALGPVVEKIATHYHGRMKVGKMNVDEHPLTPGKYGISAIPTMLLFKNGEVVDKIIGAVPQSKISEVIEKHI